MKEILSSEVQHLKSVCPLSPANLFIFLPCGSVSLKHLKLTSLCLLFKDIKEIRSAIQEEKGGVTTPVRNSEEVRCYTIYAMMLY